MRCTAYAHAYLLYLDYIHSHDSHITYIFYYNNVFVQYLFQLNREKGQWNLEQKIQNPQELGALAGECDVFD